MREGRSGFRLALNPGYRDCAVKKVLRRIAKLDYREIETRKVRADPAFGRVGVLRLRVGIDGRLRRRFRAPAIPVGGRLIFLRCYINDAVTT